MRSKLIRRASMVVIAVGILAVLAKAVFTAGAASSAQIILAAAGCVFGYIVVRLAQTLFAADPERRRTARVWLMAAAAVPVFVLTPTAIGSSPPELTSTLLIAAAVWLALAMAYTSFVLARAGRVSSSRLTLDERRAMPKDGVARRRRTAFGVVSTPRRANHAPTV